MGDVQATIALSNPRQPQLHPLEVTALADTGALMLCIPPHVVLQVPYVGPVRVAYEGRSCFVGALVLGDSVLLGAVPMEDMDLIVDPARQRLEPDPRSPNIPHALLKGVTRGEADQAEPTPT
ncbi:clan AA aspartic protease [Synechococcus sp. BA-132 BA5]|uniref:clan AA aspartic protease n=1 Tax=Synechococcus sp. BA-132 BA5 TaxID=3110252 RepID=UPI002B213A74|nr:clan AA aspartic protease [Synechococcus sp. BA-132 BA5]MEA5413863.1 clan AA aspartic protease [Synechococcus sp. BA-132 BA5]